VTGYEGEGFEERRDEVGWFPAYLAVERDWGGDARVCRRYAAESRSISSSPESDPRSSDIVPPEEDEPAGETRWGEVMAARRAFELELMWEE
jgi:hypothetical protein